MKALASCSSLGAGGFLRLVATLATEEHRVPDTDNNDGEDNVLNIIFIKVHDVSPCMFLAVGGVYHK